ncbi:hypothetical protein VN12_10615 [Pirellula sp. SH-Sr6A]|nr:hypothetical protein VN12_10615 [Pirellula sp. SH-Sr6A]
MIGLHRHSGRGCEGAGRVGRAADWYKRQFFNENPLDIPPFFLTSATLHLELKDIGA